MSDYVKKGSAHRFVQFQVDRPPSCGITRALPRKLRLEYPGAMYHLMSRGDRRDRIFLDDVDRHDFIKTLAEACQKTGWQVHGTA